MAWFAKQDDPSPEEIQAECERIRAENQQSGKRSYGGRHNKDQQVEIREYHVGRLDGKTSRLPPERE